MANGLARRCPCHRNGVNNGGRKRVRYIVFKLSIYFNVYIFKITKLPLQWNYYWLYSSLKGNIKTIYTGQIMLSWIFAIQLKSEKTYSYYTVRTFLLTTKKVNLREFRALTFFPLSFHFGLMVSIFFIHSKSRKNRQITHIQFTAWTKLGTPYRLDLLVHYCLVTRAMEKYPEN